MSSSVSHILAALFPRRCPVCGQFTGSGALLCRKCAANLELEYKRLCPICHREAPNCRCAVDAVSDTPLFCCGFYEAGNTTAILSRLVFSLKQNSEDSAAHVLALDLSRVILKQFLAEGEDIRTWTVTYAPRSTEGYARHGFDQSRRLAKLCARLTGARFRPIFRRHGGGVQKELSASDRRVNAASIRLLHPTRRYEGKYLVIDDIVTTGATLGECAAQLRRCGAKDVRFAAPLRALPRRPKKELWFAGVGNNHQ